MSKEFFCTTSNVPFSTEAELREHYRSEFHRYNLKRRVAGLGPVTKEWFETHKDKLLAAARKTVKKEDKTFYEPLSGKHFSSELKYNEYVNSNKYKKLLKRQGGPRPDPVVKERAAEAKPDAEPRTSDAPAALATHPLSPMGRGRADRGVESDGESSSWETASEAEEMSEGEEGEAWDVCRSLFDNHVSRSIEENMEYMYKKFGFYVPDVECLVDATGLVEYLGAKVSQGKIPLYASGLDGGAKSFGSMHAVQRHMVDTGKTKLLYEGNEDEYEDYFDYSKLEVPAEAGEMQVVDAAGPSVDLSSNGYELTLADARGGSRILGSRSLARYYKQRPKPEDSRESVIANRIQASYRAMGLLALRDSQAATFSMNDQELKTRQHNDKLRLHTGIANDKINNLPKNVPY